MISRRSLFRIAGLVGAGGALSSRGLGVASVAEAGIGPAEAAAAANAAKGLYESIGVRPLIN
jgi:hypothetical protein